MKRLSMLLAALAFGLWLGQAQAWWGDDWYDDNDWPVWTPMYWAEEFADEIDDDDDWYGPYGPYGYPYYGWYGYPAYGYGYPYYGYGYYPPYPYWRRHRHWW